jgi:ribosomal-protein-alanine N-acetyltransferase
MTVLSAPVRLAGQQDVEVIREIEIEAFGFTWEGEVFQRELRRTDCLFALLEQQGQTVATASLNWILDEVHLMSIAVAPPWRGQGLARQLLGQCLAFCQLLELRWMTLEVKWSNEPALALYKSFGFTTVGKRKKYYRDGQDARIMWSSPLSEARYQEQLEPYREAARQLHQQWKESRP